MTDYLELLLDTRQDEDEADETFVWKRITVGYRSLSGEDGPGQRLSREKADMQLAGEQGRKERPWTQDMYEKRQPVDPEGRLAALERAVARGKVQQMTRERSREPAGWTRVEGGQDVRRMNAMPGAQRSLAGMLDAAFERDARRYDGPLGLF